MRIREIEVVSVPVSDPERSKAFYVDILGFHVVADAPLGDGIRWIQVAPPGVSHRHHPGHLVRHHGPGQQQGAGPESR